MTTIGQIFKNLYPNEGGFGELTHSTSDLEQGSDFSKSSCHVPEKAGEQNPGLLHILRRSGNILIETQFSRGGK